MKKKYGKKFSSKFPAQRLTTSLDWSDVVLADQTRDQLRELESWLKHGDTLLDEWGMRGKIKPGFRALFEGSPGTGKTLTATLLGKSSGRHAYRVPLSAIVSKYIGETEKNLAKVFAKAENGNWILFFDEADALFGKRTDVRDAHDRYANQEVSYLLQGLEAYGGLAILASNHHVNIDKSIVRHFQAVIDFPAPDSRTRLRMWTSAFPGKTTLEEEVDLGKIAEKYPLNQAAIMNVVQYCCLRTLERDTNVILLRDIVAGVQSEIRKSEALARRVTVT